MIKVSDITTYLKCPRMCYFMNRGHDLINEISPGYLERIILKELALTYDSAVSSNDNLSFLKTGLERISNEIRVIYPNELKSVDDLQIAISIWVNSFVMNPFCAQRNSN
jgi:CRISPR-associated exonuclease Cas4